MGFFISQLRSCDEVFAHVSMHVHRGVTVRVPLSVCKTDV